METLPLELISNIFSYVPKDKDMSSPVAAIFKEGYRTEIMKLDYKENKLWEQLYENNCDVNSITFERMLKTVHDMLDETKCKKYKKYYRTIWLWLYKEVYGNESSDDES